MARERQLATPIERPARRVRRFAAQDTSWWLRGACRDKPRELFFPRKGASHKQIEQAKAVCATCPVRAECLAWTLSLGEGGGIWGGTTANERKVLRKRQEAA